MTDKLFKIAGVSRRNGILKIRFGNDMIRVKLLAGVGETDIVFVELGGELTKLEAAKEILGNPAFNDDAQDVIRDYIVETEAKLAPKKPRAKKAKATTLEDDALAQAREMAHTLVTTEETVETLVEYGPNENLDADL